MVEKVVNIKVQEQGFDDLNSKVQRLENSLEDLEQQNDSLRSSMANSGKSVLDNGGAMGLLNDLTGGLAMTIKDAVEATDLFTKSTKAQTTFQKIQTAVMGTSTGALKAFRLALVATGIGAIVVGLGLLIANFDKVKNAVLNLIPGLSAVGDFFGKLYDAVTDFVGITSEATRELDKMAEQANRTLDKNKLFLDAYGDQYDEFTKRKIEANNTYAEHVKTINENEELSEAEKLSRLKLLRERANRDIAQADADREEANRKRRQQAQDKINAENKKIKDDKKADDEKAEADEKQRQLEAYNAGVTAAANYREELKELRKKYEEQKEQEELDEAYRSAQEAIKNANDKIALEKKTAEEEIAIQQELLRQKEVIADANMKIATKSVDLLGQLSGKSKALQKAGIIASAAIGIYSVIKDTQAANIAAIAPPPLGLGPIAGVGLQAKNTIGGALSIASITAASAKALKAVGGGSVGGGSISGGSGGGGSSAPSFNLVQGTGSNQIATSIGSQSRPLQAYVVGSAVTSQQELDRNAIKTASL
jgi:hypothetical protein